jgi:hypothetical protein
MPIFTANFRLLLLLAPVVASLPFAWKAVERRPEIQSIPAPHSEHPTPEILRWKDYLQNHPSLAPYSEVLIRLSERLPLDHFKALPPNVQKRLAAFTANRLEPDRPVMTLCWAPGLSKEAAMAFHLAEEMAAQETAFEEMTSEESHSEGIASEGDPVIDLATQFDDSDRWRRTATFNSFFERAEQGLPTTLLWGFMQDGTRIEGFNGEPTSGSDLIAFLDEVYEVEDGGTDLTTRPWFSVFQGAFDHIASLTGITYIYEPNDDGARLSNFSRPSGRVGLRADIRIGGHYIDGDSGSNTLAYNFAPESGGDMIIDTGNTSFYGRTTLDSINLRNVVEHEHCHGLGLSHVCPINETKLMEPFISRRFRGLQLDDIFSLNRLYGDFYEKENLDRDNDSPENATILPVTVGEIFKRESLSIDDNSDIDFYQLEDLPAGTPLTVKVTPVATPPDFVEGPQNSDGSCSAGSNFDFTNIHDLQIEIISMDGRTVLSQANNQPLGMPEEIIAFEAPLSSDYYLRVSGDSANNTQLYSLEVDLSRPPSPPSDFIANVNATGQVTLSWKDNSDNETGFEIERKLESEGNWETYADIEPGIESFQDLNPTTGINLFYRVIATGTALNSEPSDESTIMVVDQSAQSYRYDFGTTTSPTAPDHTRISPLTRGHISWSGSVLARDREDADLANRDFVISPNSETWSHLIENGRWKVSVRQGDKTRPRDNLVITAEGILQKENINALANGFVETTFFVEVTDGILDLTFDDLGGENNRWVVNRISLNSQSPYEAWATSQGIPETQSSPNQDPDADGIPNIQEFFFGLPPLQKGPAIKIKSSSSEDGLYSIVSFSKNPAAPLESVIFEMSEDLISWVPFIPSPESITLRSVGNFEKVSFRMPGIYENAYIRLGLNVPD